MAQTDWDDTALRLLVAEIRMASGSPEYVQREGALLVVLNAGHQATITLPETAAHHHWVRQFDTAQTPAIGQFEGMDIAAASVVVYVLEACPT